MSPLSRTHLHSAGRWAVGVALVAAAWGVMAITPNTDFAKQTFPVAATRGEPAEGRNLRLTVLEVSGASALSDPYGWRGDGPWLLVTYEAEALFDERGAWLGRVELQIGDRIYEVTDRPDSRTERTRLAIGLPTRTTAAFELPADALEDSEQNRRAVVSFAYDRNNRQLDSVITYDVDLTRIPFDAPAELPNREWSR